MFYNIPDNNAQGYLCNLIPPTGVSITYGIKQKQEIPHCLNVSGITIIRYTEIQSLWDQRV